MEKAWFDDINVLFQSDKISNFWPSAEQPINERVNNASRFIIYASAIIYMYRRDIRVITLACALLTALYVLYRTGRIQKLDIKSLIPNAFLGCQKPTKENPMANVLYGDYTENPNRDGACEYSTVRELVQANLDKTFTSDPGKRNIASRAFYSNPSTTIPNDQTAFAEALYGKKNAPHCRDDPSMCMAENPRMPERVHMRGFTGGADQLPYPY